jgi:hypothetical protein
VKKTVIKICVIALIHFSIGFFFCFFKNLEFNVVAKIVSSLFFGIVFVLVIEIIKLWQKQWENKPH